MIDEQKFFPIVSILLFIFICIGLVGNLLNLIIFCHKSMRKNSTFRYLFYLSVIDLFVLTFCASDTFLTFGFLVMIRSYFDIVCKIHTFLTYYLTHMSSIILMIVNIDRAFIIYDKSFADFLFSQKTLIKHKILQNLNKTKKVDRIVLAVGFLIACVNLHYIFFIKLIKIETPSDGNATSFVDNTTLFKSKISIGDLSTINNKLNVTETINSSSKLFNYVCFTSEDTIYYYFLMHVWVWIDMILYSLLPFVIMTVCSILIVVQIKTKTKNFLNNYVNETKNKMCMIRSRKRNRQLLIMLTITNLYFIICSLPLCISLIYYKFIGIRNETHLVQTAFHVLAYSNNSINFVFFSLFSKKYQERFRNLTSCFRIYRKAKKTQQDPQPIQVLCQRKGNELKLEKPNSLIEFNRISNEIKKSSRVFDDSIRKLSSTLSVYLRKNLSNNDPLMSSICNHQNRNYSLLPYLDNSDEL
jgi:hypothetical protein